MCNYRLMHYTSNLCDTQASLWNRAILGNLTALTQQAASSTTMVMNDINYHSYYFEMKKSCWLWNQNDRIVSTLYIAKYLNFRQGDVIFDLIWFYSARLWRYNTMILCWTLLHIWPRIAHKADKSCLLPLWS